MLMIFFSGRGQKARELLNCAMSYDAVVQHVKGSDHNFAMEDWHKVALLDFCGR
jgi:hypothetical protein